MTVSLSSLRVVGEFDASGYARGAAQKVSADQHMIAADKARNASLAQADAALAKAIPGVSRLSASLLDGYGAGQKFDAAIRRVGNAVDQGLSLDRANLMLDSAYRKFGLTADAAHLAEAGFVSIAPAIDALNVRYAAHAEATRRLIAETEALATAQRAQVSINSLLGVGANDNSTARGADIAALGSSLDNLRAKYSPLYAAQREYLATLRDLNSLEARTALTERERATAITRTKEAFASQVTAIRAAGAETGLAAHQMTNLGYQVNDIVTGLASGQSPFMIMAQQGGQVQQILASGQGGVTGSLKSIGTTLVGLVTPGRAAFAAIAASTGLATTALILYEGRLNEVRRQLAGIGRASGATVGDIDAIAQQSSAKSGGISVNNARELATELAATGKIGVDSIKPIVDLGHDFAKTYGIEAKEAAGILARAFADPVRGADELNQRLGFLDANTKLLIESLVTQGNRQEAVRILTDKIRGSIAEAADVTSFWARGWENFRNNATGAFDALGRQLDRLTQGGSGLDEQLANITTRIIKLQGARYDIKNSYLGSFIGDAGAIEKELDELIKKMEELQAKRLKLTKQDNARSTETADKQRGLEIDAIARATLPAIDNTRKLRDETAALNEAFSNPAVGKWVSLVGGDLVRALERKSAAERASVGFDPVASQIKDTEAQIQALDQRSIAARARFAREAEARRQANDPNAGTKAERDQKQDQAARLAAGGQTALDSVRSQSISILGDLATVEQKVIEKRLALINASRDGITVTDRQRDAILNIVRAQEEWNRVSGAVSIGIFDVQRAARAASAEFQTWIDRGYLDPSKPEQYAAAVNAMQRKLMDAADAAKVAGSQFPQLQNLANEAGRVDKQFDAFAVTSLSSVSPALQDMLLGTTSLAQGFSNLGVTIVKALTDAVVKITIIKPLIDSLTASLGGGTFAGGLGALGITYGAPGTAGSNMAGPIAPSARGNAFNGSNVIPFARGSAFTNGVYNSPTFFKFANGAGMSNGVMAEAGPEAVMPLRRGPGGRLGVEVNGGGGSAPIVNVSVKNYGNDNVSMKQQPNRAGGVDLEFMVGQAATKQMAKPGSSLRQVTDQRGTLASR